MFSADFLQIFAVSDVFSAGKSGARQTAKKIKKNFKNLLTKQA
jgi:hypothetical protein